MNTRTEREDLYVNLSDSQDALYPFIPSPARVSRP